MKCYRPSFLSNFYQTFPRSTKYEIKLNVKITVNHDEKELGVLNLTDKISYNVNSQYSQTIINENQAIKTLTSGLVDQILKELSLLNLNLKDLT